MSQGHKAPQSDITCLPARISATEVPPSLLLCHVSCASSHSIQRLCGWTGADLTAWVLPGVNLVAPSRGWKRKGLGIVKLD